ncbi:MAG: YicC family protein [Treponema sp.]|jgi:uncharacterized protein (TIGR00255 family)|nr:YicC family protein [Treponema sp.]
MTSMTGYAYREKTGNDLSVSAEIRGCNSRYLEISISLPPWLSNLEAKVREQIASCCGRGKVECYIRVREHNAPIAISVNKNAAKAYYDAVNNLAEELGMGGKCSLDALLGMEGVLETEKNRDDERYWQEIQPVFSQALQAFCIEREREGNHTKDDILGNLNIIETSVKNVASFAPSIEQTIKENIKSRFTELLGNQVDENRILAETASMLLKYTISEEISRLVSHIGEFRAEAERNTTCGESSRAKPGKKCDFLSQEINREINTIGSKSAVIEVSGEVVKMKEALENIREQLRNVE